MSLLTAILFLAGLALLTVGADVLVRGASRLAAALGLSPLVIGLTVVAFGTSAPELAVSMRSSLGGEADVALGNVVGSNIFNVLLILGVCAAISPLVIAQQLVRIDVPLMIGASALLYLLALDGGVGRVEGGLLAAGLAAYVAFSVIRSRKESAAVREEYAREFGEKKPVRRFGLLADVGLVVAGLALLILGAHWLVDGAVAAARALGLSELVVGLTIVAGGTSLPEVATSVVAALRGERDIAAGNVVGSNLFNILGVLGFAALAAPQGMRVAPSALSFDIPVMVAVAVACLPVFFTGYRIARWEGVLFLAYYIAYVGFLVLDATDRQALSVYGWVLGAFVIPLTATTLVVFAWRAWRAGALTGGEPPRRSG